MNGSCHCGQLSYQLKEKPLFSGFCHCHACQKRSSAPCVGLFLIQKKNIRFNGESDSRSGLGGSGKEMINHRCKSCGDAIYSDLKVLDDVVVCLSGTLNDQADFEPEGHLWVSKRNPRFEINDNLEQQAGPPMQMMPFLA